MKGIAVQSVLLAFIAVSCNEVEKGVIQREAEQVSLVVYVNPLMGTDSKFSLSNGNIYPAIATPWGMNL